MLVTCPKCGARYDIDGALIPPAGRRVQCSACDHVWQQGAVADASSESMFRDDEDAEAHDDETTPPPPMPQRPLADGVRSILREEAAHDTRTRRERGLREVQPERRLAADDRTAPAYADAGSAGLPDPDAINATLRAASTRAASTGRTPDDGVGGFRVGLGLGLGLVGLAALLYGLAGPLAAAMPSAEAVLDSYVAAVDGLLATIHRLGDSLGDAFTNEA